MDEEDRITDTEGQETITLTLDSGEISTLLRALEAHGFEMAMKNKNHPLGPHPAQVRVLENCQKLNAKVRSLWHTAMAEKVIEPKIPIIEGEWVDKYEMPHPGDDYDY